MTLFQPPQKGDRHLTPHDLGLDVWQLELRIEKATDLYLSAELNEDEYRTSSNLEWALARRRAARKYRAVADNAAQSVYDLLRDLEG